MGIVGEDRSFVASRLSSPSPGASFELNRFYKEIAVGLGLGLRLDFSFLVFRFDYGMKIKDPRFPEGDRWQIPFKRADQGVWNIAVGYPF